ncbi:MAG: hypothetical protein IJH39_07940 [Clostridia bacterium]|nr:hypothetical protein [Clostridia bacterium]
MLKKQIKQYKSKNSSTRNIALTNKDIKTLQVEFKETNKNYLTSNDIFLINQSEYDQLNKHKTQANDNKNSIDQLNKTNDQLKEQIETLTANNETLLQENKEKTNTIETLTLENETLSNRNRSLEQKNKNLENKHQQEIRILENINYQYQLIIKDYETQIKTYNNLSFISRLINTNKLELVKKEEYKLNIGDYNKTIYELQETKKE